MSLGFLARHDDHGAGRVAHQVVHRASQQRGAGGAAAVRPDHQQLGAVLG